MSIPGGSNIQFGIHPETGRIIVIEMNPRVSRSSALASKATGYPIAKIAAKLAIGLTLDEIANDITKTTPASFEPTMDYVITKFPRFNFEKFRGADTTLTTQMKAVGEVMAVGRTFQESVQKALRGLELGLAGFVLVPSRAKVDFWEWRRRLSVPTQHRITDIFGALDAGISIDEVAELSKIDPWFLDNLLEIYQETKAFSAKVKTLADFDKDYMWHMKRMGFSDVQLADLVGVDESAMFEHRQKLGIAPVYKMIDTCAAEFEASTPYLYSTYDEETEVPPSTKPSHHDFGWRTESNRARHRV